MKRTFSDFIRNAAPEEKREVYERVIDGAIARQGEVVIDHSPQTPLDILTEAFEDWLNAINPRDYPSPNDREMMLSAFIAGAIQTASDFEVVAAAQALGANILPTNRPPSPE